MAKKAEKSVRPIKDLIVEYREFTIQEGIIKKRKEELAKEIKEYAVNHGVKNDAGSYYAENDRYVFGSQARKSVKLNDERAKELFISKGLWSDVIDIKEIINESKVEKLIEQDKISYEELEEVTDIKITYAIDVREKEQVQKPEDMPEIQVISNSKKSNLKRF